MDDKVRAFLDSFLRDERIAVAHNNETEILALPFDLDSFDDPYLPEEIEPYQDTTIFDYY